LALMFLLILRICAFFLNQESLNRKYSFASVPKQTKISLFIWPARNTKMISLNQFKKTNTELINQDHELSPFLSLGPSEHCIISISCHILHFEFRSFSFEKQTSCYCVMIKNTEFLWNPMCTNIQKPILTKIKKVLK
jgi:hypothetical protein